MSTALRKLSYPYITSDPEIAGGVPIIEGTRITVRCIAGYYQMGISVDEILGNLSHLTASQVHSALAYYFDYQEEVEREIADNHDLNYWQSQAKQRPESGV